MRWIARSLLFIALTLLTAELVLQGAALLVHDRSTVAREGRVTILCVGDSHTYGAMVTPEQAYPGSLSAELDAVAPGFYRVVNLGVPGFNTTQVRNRLPDQIRRYRPAMVVVWVGVNDIWNITEVDAPASAWRLRLDVLATRSRLYRLVRARLHDMQIDRDRGVADGDPVPSQLDEVRREFEYGGIAGLGERGAHSKDTRAPKADQEMIDRARRNYLAMATWAKEAQVPLAFITYYFGTNGFGGANRAVSEAAAESGALVIPSLDAILRIPRGERNFLWAAHPSAAMYREIARDVSQVVLATVPPFRGRQR